MSNAIESTTRLVVDASVAIKWHISEDHKEAALRLLADDAPAMHVPDLMYPEFGNIAWKKVRRGELTEDQARGIVHLLTRAPLEVHPSPPLIEAAFEIAASTGRSVYDSLYVALAVRLDCRLVTADERLCNALKDGPLGAHILWIGDDLGVADAVGIAESYVMPDFVIPPDFPTVDEIELLYSFQTSDWLTDDNLTQLTGLKDLRELYLQSPGITDSGLIHLSGLDRLRTLYLGGTSVTDAGLTHLRGLASLRTLNLSRMNISDAGMAQLSKLTGLRALVLWGTRVTDVGLKHLHGLVGLREIDLEQTAVSEAGIEELRKLIPGIDIIR